MTRRLLIFASTFVLAVPAACSDGGSTILVTTGDSGVDAPEADVDGGPAGDGRDAPDATPDGTTDATGDAGVPVSIKVTGDHCPTVGAAASPQSAPTGRSISISAEGQDQDGDVLSFHWSASSGTFSAPDARMGQYTCEAAGEQILTIAVSDGRCSAESVVPVTCAAGP